MFKFWKRRWLIGGMIAVAVLGGFGLTGFGSGGGTAPMLVADEGPLGHCCPPPRGELNRSTPHGEG